MFRYLNFTLLAMLMFSGLWAQRTIVGKVIDCEGESLEHVTITIKGTKIKTTTNDSGFYKINVPDGKVKLIFENYWFEKKVVRVKKNNELNVKMVSEFSEPESSTVYKPVIYLYPEKTTDITLQVNFNGKMDFTYPAYNNAWNVTAHANGKLIDKSDGREHNYLFWDGQMHFTKEQTTYTSGFVVHKDSLVAFFQKHLPLMGLKPHEYNDFIVFWTPLMQKNEWNFVHFRNGAAYNIVSTNSIIPKPDSEIRVFMDFKKVDKPFDFPAQEIVTPKRHGFTLVEWGGAAIEQEVLFKTPDQHLSLKGKSQEN